MKKKAKLFLSMASMVLAVALFCFGVYAAVSVNYTISGTVTYQVKDVYTEITTKVYKDAIMYNASNLQTKAQELESKTFSQIEETYGQAVQTFNTYNNLTGTGEAGANGIDINYNNAFTYYVVINVKNLSSSVNVNISLTNNTTGDINSVIYQTANKTNIAKLAEGTNMVVAFSLDDATKSVQNVAFNYSLKVELSTPGYTVTVTNNVSSNCMYYAYQNGNELINFSQDGSATGQFVAKGRIYLHLIGDVPSFNNIDWGGGDNEVISSFVGTSRTPGKMKVSVQINGNTPIVGGQSDGAAWYSYIFLTITEPCTIIINYA